MMMHGLANVKWNLFVCNQNAALSFVTCYVKWRGEPNSCVGL